MQLVIGKRKFTVVDFADASAVYGAARDKSGKGMRHWPEGKVFDGDKEVARISYNGRVWSPEPWTVDSIPLYDNR